MNDVPPPRQASKDGDQPVKLDLVLARQLELAREVLRAEADALRELAKK